MNKDHKVNFYISSLDKDHEHKMQLHRLLAPLRFLREVKRSNDAYEIIPSLIDVDIIKTLQHLYISKVDLMIILAGPNTPRKNDFLYDWEIAAAFNTEEGKQAKAFLVVLCPDAEGPNRIYSELTEKATTNDWSDVELAERHWTRIATSYPTLSTRVLDNLFSPKVKIDVITWDKINSERENLEAIITSALRYAGTNEYVTTRPLIHSRLIK